ncbi:MAG: TetR/AcrR family transcriptional regulator [Eubacteriales bacterium]
MKKSERTERTVAKIMRAAMHEFGSCGYAGGSVNNICKTGINKGLLYHNFQGKDALYLACLKQSCDRLMQYLQNNDAETNPARYMRIRLDFFREYPEEAHIFFEALLNPPAHLKEETDLCLCAFRTWNEAVYSRTLDTLKLRPDVTKEDAMSYFHLMQLMLNGYFSSPAFQNTAAEEKIEIHEKTVSGILDFMLYGIAEGEN